MGLSDGFARTSGHIESRRKLYMLVFVDKQSFYLSKHSSNETVFTENGEHRLQLDIGDTVHILEEADGKP